MILPKLNRSLDCAGSPDDHIQDVVRQCESDADMCTSWLMLIEWFQINGKSTCSAWRNQCTRGSCGFFKLSFMDLRFQYHPPPPPYHHHQHDIRVFLPHYHYHNVTELLLLIVKQVSMANYGVGGMSSAFQLLEISHTHFWTKVSIPRTFYLSIFPQ